MPKLVELWGVPTRSSRSRWLAVAASSLLISLTVAPARLGWLAPVCAVPLLVALEGVTGYHAFILGLWHGVVANAIIFHWTLPALLNAGGLGVLPGLAVFAALVVSQGFRSALIAVAYSWCADSGARFRVFAFVPAVVAVELLFPVPFPWFLGTVTSEVVPWLQFAELGGPLALSCWVALVNAFFAHAWLLGRTHAAARSVLVGGATLLAITLGGLALEAAAQRRTEQGSAWQIGVVQAGVAPRELDAPVETYVAATRALLAGSPGLDLVVWPETALSVATPTSRLVEFESYLAATFGTNSSGTVPLLTGIVLEDQRGRFNSALLFGGKGHEIARYDKRALVPVGERRLTRDSRLGPHIAFEPGTAARPLPFGKHRLSTSICYEDILPEAFRHGVEADTDLLVNLTSDSWFQGSTGPALHLTVARMRAVEHRRYLLRATTTGETALVGPTGRTVWTLPSGAPASGVAQGRWLAATTAFERFGNWPWFVAPMLVLVMSLRRRARGPAHASVRGGSGMLRGQIGWWGSVAVSVLFSACGGDSNEPVDDARAGKGGGAGTVATAGSGGTTAGVAGRAGTGNAGTPGNGGNGASGGTSVTNAGHGGTAAGRDGQGGQAGTNAAPGGAGAGASSSGGAAGTGADFGLPPALLAAVSAFCEAVAPCCDARGITSRVQDCEATYALRQTAVPSLEPGVVTLDTAVLERCRAAYAAGPDQCNANAVIAACRGAFIGTRRENEPCIGGYDCDRSTDVMTCLIPETSGDNLMGVCKKVPHAKLGEPCLDTCRDGADCSTTSLGSVTADEVARCFESEGLYCDQDGDTPVCKGIIALGEPCGDTHAGCGPNATCDGTCQPLSKRGEPCGLGCLRWYQCGDDGTCQDPSWANSLTCDGVAPAP